MAILYGAGRLTFTESNSGDGLLLPIEPMSFNLSNDSETVKSTKFVDGMVQTAGSAIRSSEWTLTLGIEAINWAAIQFALGELAGTTASIEMPELRYGQVPATGTFEWDDADIDTNLVRVALLSDDDTTSLTTVATAPSDATEVQVDDASNKLVFHADHAGRSFSYRVFTTLSDVSSIGAEQAYQAISKFAFEGILTTDGPPVKIVIPQLVRSSFPNIDVQGVSRFDIEFDLLSVGNARLPFQLYKLPVA